MKIRTVRALRFWAVVCAFSMAGITASSGGQIGYYGSAIPLDQGGAGETPPPVLTPVVVATGLENPRGIKVGPDRRLYVAEGGTGGTRSTVGRCPQVPAPTGPYLGGFTGRVSAVDVTKGVRTTITGGLPSNQTSAAGGSDASSVADVAFLHGTLYALISGAGCSHGLAGTFNGIDRIGTPGSAVRIVNLTKFQKTHPVAHPSPGDFEPDGSWYSLVASDDALYAVEPNHGEVDVVKPDGNIRRLVDVSATQGHIVPTSLTSFYGQFLFGNLYVFAPGSQGHAESTF